MTRKQRLEDYCRTHTFNKKPTREDLQYIAVDDENKIMYCALHKVASKTWIKILEDLRGVKEYVRRWGLFRRFGDYTEEEKVLRLQTYFKFLIVREPLHRLLSTFKERWIQGGRDQNSSRIGRQLIVLSLRPEELNQNEENHISFSEFIQYFSTNVTREPHCLQYEKICHPCVLKYDFIGHFETMGEDGPVILKMAGIDDRVTFPPIHKATGSSEVLKYYSQVPPRYITRLGELYRNDFEMFGYEYLGPVKHLLHQSTNGA
ncbi:Carbohydrate (chondroitin 4) sulfotransferase 13 [Desmophyllum pertusum]|uniref:Carbohydrate sulfotransferase n=1 Tax=Desmophyllum pertusum TaxID=174260 RepID=A0A9W9ZCZ4_9CNID|nr:Carbohydrate (chondroitin 4) sulfotransferase 13 [Desmophyllum pertusum]